MLEGKTPATKWNRGAYLFTHWTNKHWCLKQAPLSGKKMVEFTTVCNKLTGAWLSLTLLLSLSSWKWRDLSISLCYHSYWLACNSCYHVGWLRGVLLSLSRFLRGFRSRAPIECATKWTSPHARASMTGLSLDQQSVTAVWYQCTCLTVVAWTASSQVVFCLQLTPLLDSYVIRWCSSPYKCKHLFGLPGWEDELKLIPFCCLANPMSSLGRDGVEFRVWYPAVVAQIEQSSKD